MYTITMISKGDSGPALRKLQEDADCERQEAALLILRLHHGKSVSFLTENRTYAVGTALEECMYEVEINEN